jgi:hypothetical protein
MLEERKLGTNPGFKKARSIGEKVANARDKKEDLTRERVDIKA